MAEAYLEALTLAERKTDSVRLIIVIDWLDHVMVLAFCCQVNDIDLGNILEMNEIRTKLNQCRGPTGPPENREISL